MRGGVSACDSRACGRRLTEVSHIHHIDRGYEKLEQNLCDVGAVVKRLE